MILEDFTNGNRDLVNRLNELVAIARQVQNMTGDDTIKVRHTASGINVSMDRQRRSSGGITIHKAYVKTAPGATNTVDCYLDTDTTGDEITVTCEIHGGTALDECINILDDGDEMKVFLDGDTWRCIDGFQAIDICEEGSSST